MSQKDYHKVLGLSQGASEKQIKTAYRKLALKYHPDRNKAPGAKHKFHELTLAYDYLLKHPYRKEDSASSYEDRMASEVLRRERERMQAQAKARREKKKREEEYFNRPEWHDPLLLLKYGIRGFALLFASVAIIFPILLAIFGDPLELIWKNCIKRTSPTRQTNPTSRFRQSLIFSENNSALSLTRIFPQLTKGNLYGCRFFLRML